LQQKIKKKHKSVPREVKRLDCEGEVEHIHVEDKAGDIIRINRDGTLDHDGRVNTVIEFSNKVWDFLIDYWFNL
jgi:hypothetical protein